MDREVAKRYAARERAKLRAVKCKLTDIALSNLTPAEKLEAYGCLTDSLESIATRYQLLVDVLLRD